jgi:hypothetical protein
MTAGNLNKTILRSGVSIVAALLLSTAVFAQDATDGAGPDPLTDQINVQNWHDLTTIDVATGGDDQGIAVGEPDPTAGGEPDVVVDDGTGGDPADDPMVDPMVDDGTGDGSTGDPTGTDGTGTDGIGDGSTGDGGVVVDDGEVLIYYMDGGPEFCAECDFQTVDLSAEAFQTGVNVPQVTAHAAPAAKPRRSKAHPIVSSVAASCLAQHPQLPWLCEWQNGAGQ